MATGGSARSIREHLLLNGRFFLGEEDYTHFTNEMLELRWFQLQRKGMGLESMVLTFIRLAKAERVDQWGFEETSLNGVATLNQWCRIVEDNEAVVLTIECAGLLPGSTSAQVTKHVKATWERGAKVVAMVRAELGDYADELVPLAAGVPNVLDLYLFPSMSHRHSAVLQRISNKKLPLDFIWKTVDDVWKDTCHDFANLFFLSNLRFI